MASPNVDSADCYLPKKGNYHSNLFGKNLLKWGILNHLEIKISKETKKKFSSSIISFLKHINWGMLSHLVVEIGKETKKGFSPSIISF